jgi:hypothetical protein
VLENPELAEGYERLFLGYLLWGNLPWLVMGTGLEFGGVSSVFSFLRPGDGNAFVLAWFAVLIAELILGLHWLFVRNGAEFLAKHPSLVSHNIKNPTAIKALYCLMAAGGIAGLMSLFVFPPPEFVQ